MLGNWNSFCEVQLLNLQILNRKDIDPQKGKVVSYGNIDIVLLGIVNYNNTFPYLLLI